MILPRETVYAAFWAQVLTAVVQTTDTDTVPVSQTLMTSKPWVSDVGVTYGNLTPLTKVPSAPAVGQYSVSAGVYSFASADVGQTVLITYNVSPFLTTNRRLKHWDDVPANEQPALYMTQDMEDVKQVKGLPPTWDFKLHLWIYDNCQGNPSAIPGQRLNYLLDSVDNALAPVGGSGGYQTLGGLVSHCWIAGPIDIYEGYKGMLDQSVAIIPVGIRVPDSSGPGY